MTCLAIGDPGMMTLDPWISVGSWLMSAPSTCSQVSLAILRTLTIRRSRFSPRGP